MAENPDSIISVHKSHAQAIMAGRKTVELRRRFLDLAPGSRLWIYETVPTGAVIGFVTVRAVERATPALIWKRHGEGSAIDRGTFIDYFVGTSEAVAILVAAACRILPVSIAQMRRIRDGFHPPRVAFRLSLEESSALRTLVAEREAAPHGRAPPGGLQAIDLLAVG